MHIDSLGHAISFSKDADKTLTYGRLYFGNTREPWGMTVASQQIYVMTSASDVSTVYKNIDQLTFDDYIEDMMLRFGASKKAVGRMMRTPDQLEEPLQPFNPIHQENLCYITVSHSTIKPFILAESGATKAFFGNRLIELEPKLYENFFYFDDNSWKFTYKIPRPWSSDIYAAKKTAQDAMDAYFHLPQQQRPDAACLIQTLGAEMRARNIGSSDIAALLMITFWV
ncbi:MAG: hypothetical protein LQ337_007557 [Flavoplaca oasis]|nr:MAG: hypothetical protein LQ337_007557 [Flavoplaca oasis]